MKVSTLVSLAAAGLSSLASAAAIATSNTVTKSVTKRAGFDTASQDNLCGETNPWFDYSAAAPLASDCAQLAPWWDYTSDGAWELAPSDFSPSTGWATVHAIGTCAFAVRHQVAADAGTSVMLGTNDLRFYVNMALPSAQDGKIGAQGTMECYNGETNVDLLWGLIHT